MKEQAYRRAWRSFYLHFAAIFAVFILVAWASFKAPLQPVHQKWMWIAFLVFVIAAFLDMTIRRLQMCLFIRPNEISLSRGIFSHDSTEISLGSIRTIQVRQNLIQRMLNLGDILVASSGTDQYEINMHNVLDPHKVRNSMQPYESSFINAPKPEAPASPQPSETTPPEETPQA